MNSQLYPIDEHFKKACVRPGCGCEVTRDTSVVQVVVPAVFLATSDQQQHHTDLVSCLDGCWGVVGACCATCEACVSLYLPREGWCSLDQVLCQPVDPPPQHINDWQLVTTARQRLAVFVLLHLVHNEQQRRVNEPVLVAPATTDCCLVLQRQQRFIGVAVIKLRGETVQPGPHCHAASHDRFCMHVLDALFISEQERGRHHATGLLLALLSRGVSDWLPQHRSSITPAARGSREAPWLGVTRPSAGMCHVLIKLMIRHPSIRQRVWLVETDGGENDRRCAWLVLRRQQQQQTQQQQQAQQETQQQAQQETQHETQQQQQHETQQQQKDETSQQQAQHDTQHTTQQHKTSQQQVQHETQQQ